jgi:CheY-like chemotaxis protein
VENSEGTDLSWISDPGVHCPVIVITSEARDGEADKNGVSLAAAIVTRPVLPSDLFAAVSEANVRVRAKTASEPAPGTEARTLLPQSILLAEDHPVNQVYASELLTRGGHTVTIANNGREAVEHFRKGGYDVILMDVQMPELDGLGATKLIRDIEGAAGGHIPIIAMTAHARPEDRIECLNAGMDEYLTKPVRKKDLFAVLTMVLGDKASSQPPTQAVPQTERIQPPDPAHEAPTGTPSELQRKESNADVFNEAAALDQCMGDATLLAKMAGMLIQSMDKHSEAIGQAIALRDGEGLRVAAHTIKGALGALCSSRGHAAALSLEIRGRESRFEGAQEEYQRFTNVLEQLKTILSESVLRVHA